MSCNPTVRVDGNWLVFVCKTHYVQTQVVNDEGEKKHEINLHDFAALVFAHKQVYGADKVELMNEQLLAEHSSIHPAAIKPPRKPNLHCTLCWAQSHGLLPLGACICGSEAPCEWCGKGIETTKGSLNVE